MWLPSARQLVTEEEEGSEGHTEVADPVDCLPISPEAQLKAAKTLIEVEEYNVSMTQCENHFYIASFCCYC